jgi:hypothetical protein
MMVNMMNEIHEDNIACYKKKLVKSQEDKKLD